MALLHDATVTPSKLELINAWLPDRPWFRSEAGGQSGSGVTKVAAYRLDDPAGEVGLETVLVTDGRTTYQVPLTYRSAPLAGADGHLVGTMEHSALGSRWVYDGCGDPVWAGVLATTIRSGGHQAEEYFEVDGERHYRDPGMTVRGSGTGSSADPVEVSVEQTRDEDAATVLTAVGLELVLVRRLGAPAHAAPDGALVLTGTWPGADPTVLAVLR